MSNNHNNTNEILTNKQLREYLNASRTVIDRLLKTGEIPSFRIGKNPRYSAIRVRKQDVDKWIEDHIIKKAPGI